MVEELTEIPMFWSLIVPAGKTCEVDFPVDAYLTITQATMPDLPEDGSSEPVRVYADIDTIQISVEDGEPEATAGGPERHSKILLVTLLPGEKEMQHLNVVFSPLNAVTVTNTGKCDVHLVGFLRDNGIMDDEEEEEEEEEEAAEAAAAEK